MEKKKLLLVAISVGVFLVLTIGAALLVFAPKSSAASSEAVASYSNYGTDRTTVTNPTYQGPVSAVEKGGALLDPVGLVRTNGNVPGLRQLPEGAGSEGTSFNINRTTNGVTSGTGRNPETLVNVPNPSASSSTTASSAPSASSGTTARSTTSSTSSSTAARTTPSAASNTTPSTTAGSAPSSTSSSSAARTTPSASSSTTPSTTASSATSSTSSSTTTPNSTSSSTAARTTPSAASSTTPGTTAGSTSSATPATAARTVAEAPKPAASTTPAASPAVSSSRTSISQSRPQAQTTVHNDYWVQTGAFSTLTLAEGVKATLSSKGITSLIENRDVNGTTLFRVRVGPYTSQNEANYWLSLIKTIKGFEDSQIRQTQR